MTAQKRFCQKILRSLVAAASATFLTGFSVLGVSTIASATAEGCTFAPQGAVCNKTYGDKARVDSIYAIRTRVKGDPPLVCDYSADASVLAPGGRVKLGCTPVRAFFKFNVNRTFICGDETSIRFCENKAPQGGYAIVKLNCR